MIEASYFAYLIIALALTAWVARTLSTNGEVFLIDCFGHDEVLARSTNHLLVVGFYLVNIGFILLTISLGAEPTTYAEAIRFVATKVGLAVLVLGSITAGWKRLHRVRKCAGQERRAVRAGGPVQAR